MSTGFAGRPADAMHIALLDEVERLKTIVRFCATLDLGPKGYCSMPLDQLRDQARLALQTPLEEYIGSLGSRDQPGAGQ